uniref:G_PROTEIN_RECEP_F2_4 domain-containing protein n=1 Tax=Caenorhabditis tropicalis TaxID=1561998 RepID=A0A1I7U9F8_9PELO
MLTEEWYEVEHHTQDVCGIISLVTNLLLMFLILTKSPTALGSYKWLMVYTTLFELTYALVNLFAGAVSFIFSIHSEITLFSVGTNVRISFHCVSQIEIQS